MSANGCYSTKDVGGFATMYTDRTINIAILGGDIRQIYLALALSQLGFHVTMYGNDCSYYDLPKSITDQFHQVVTRSTVFSDVITENNLIIGPIPFTKDNIHITSPSNDIDMTIVNFLQYLTNRPLIAAGNIKPNVSSFLEGHSVPYVDFMKSDAIAVYNAIATAEGTIAEAMKRSSINLHGSKVLVLGFGRCAAILAQKLHALNAHVTVAVRRRDAAAYVTAYGYKNISFDEIDSTGSCYDFIFNTVPANVLTRTVLSHLNPNVTLIDIASSPGGTDFEAAKEFGLNASLCLGLPGIYSPETSANILKDEILSIVQEHSWTDRSLQ